MTLLVDTHCHLNHEDLRDDLAGVLNRARDNGIASAVVVGYDLPSSIEAVTLTTSHASLVAAVGVHPHDARTWTDETSARIAEAALSPRVVALGEAGLDHHYDFSSRDDQRHAFREQLALAGKLDLPIVIHSREAEDEALAIVREVGLPVRGGVMHCFPGGPDLARQALDLGLYIGITGVVTFPKAQAMRDVAAFVPADRLLIETDAPYLAPVPLRGKRNEPSLLPYVVRAVADARGMTESDVAGLTTRNARELFGELIDA